MLVSQQWEPVISPPFPSQIQFWIRLHGLPLHYWHEKSLYNISLDLGTLEDYSITKSAVKIRVTLDVFKPLEKEIIFDFSSGEEQIILLEYEGLDRHCSECHSLLHSESHCALRKSQPRQTAHTTQTHPSQTHSPRYRVDTSRERSFSQHLERGAPRTANE